MTTGKHRQKQTFKFFNEHATNEEFDVFENNLHRLENIVTKDIKDIFNKKIPLYFLHYLINLQKWGLKIGNSLSFLENLKKD